MSKLDKLGLVWHTVRHMTARQWVYRLYSTLRSKRPPKDLRLPAVSQPKILPSLYPLEADLTAANGILNNRFPTVSGRVEDFHGEINWDLPGSNYRLPSFRLNSFGFLLILSDAYRTTGEKAYLEKGLSLLQDWQRRCGSRAEGDKWNAYVVAQRILNQIRFLSNHAGEAEVSAHTPMIAIQAQVLSETVEYQLGANHLLTEGCALMYAGAFLQDKKLYRKGKKLLNKEFPVQFLPDGGHFERSVSYHVEALQQYYEALLLMHHMGDSDCGQWITRLQAPYAYLNSMIQSDGRIPLINDAALDYPFSAADFLHTAAYLYQDPPPNAAQGPYSRRFALSGAEKQPIQWAQRFLYPDTGFLSARYGIHSLFLDAGDHGPDCNLGHTHADSLSMLWTAGGQPVFADSGVYTYAPGQDRNACRATAAHNTVEVDGTDSCQVWAAFRTARRGHTTIESFINHDTALCLTASHDGYRKVLADPVTHRRCLSLNKRTGLLTLTDTLIPKAQSHSAVLRFHLDPTCPVRQLDGHTVLLAEHYRLTCSHPLTLEPCRIALRFGIPEPSLCITAPFPIHGETQVTTTVTLDPVS